MVLNTKSGGYAGTIMKFQHDWVLEILEIVAKREKKKMRSFDKSCPNLVQHKFQGYGLGCSGVDNKDKALYKSKPTHAHVMKPENFSVLDQELKTQ